MDDIDKYVLEQAKAEVEHTRSWPTKILTFYTAINAAVVTAFVTARASHQAQQDSWIKVGITTVIVVLLLWALTLLIRNHKSYLQYRNMQIRQSANAEVLRKRFPVPTEWLTEHKVHPTTRWQGWGFYAYLALLVTAAALTGLWAS